MVATTPGLAREIPKVTHPPRPAGHCTRAVVASEVRCHASCTISRAMDLPLIALRFVRLADGGHLDLATGARVALRVGQVSPAERLAFDASGRALMHVWHPGLAQYLDYGPLGTDRWFEASALDADSDDAITPVSELGAGGRRRRCCRWSTRPARRSRECASAHAWLPECSQRRTSRPMRQQGLRGDVRCPGLRLIDRPLGDRLLERLDDRRSPGVTVWQVAAAPGLGWRSCWRLAGARAAQRRLHPAGRRTP